MERVAEQTLIDLSRKCGADVNERILMIVGLVDAGEDKLALAFSGASSALATTMGMAAALIPGADDPERLVDLLWSEIRPMSLAAASELLLKRESSNGV